MRKGKGIKELIVFILVFTLLVTVVSSFWIVNAEEERTSGGNGFTTTSSKGEAKLLDTSLANLATEESNKKEYDNIFSHPPITRTTVSGLEGVMGKYTNLSVIDPAKPVYFPVKNGGAGYSFKRVTNVPHIWYAEEPEIDGKSCRERHSNSATNCISCVGANSGGTENGDAYYIGYDIVDAPDITAALGKYAEFMALATLGNSINQFSESKEVPVGTGELEGEYCLNLGAGGGYLTSPAEAFLAEGREPDSNGVITFKYSDTEEYLIATRPLVVPVKTETHNLQDKRTGATFVEELASIYLVQSRDGSSVFELNENVFQEAMRVIMNAKFVRSAVILLNQVAFNIYSPAVASEVLLSDLMPNNNFDKDVLRNSSVPKKFEYYIHALTGESSDLTLLDAASAGALFVENIEKVGSEYFLKMNKEYYNSFVKIYSTNNTGVAEIPKGTILSGKGLPSATGAKDTMVEYEDVRSGSKIKRECLAKNLIKTRFELGVFDTIKPKPRNETYSTADMDARGIDSFGDAGFSYKMDSFVYDAKDYFGSSKKDQTSKLIFQGVHNYVRSESIAENTSYMLDLSNLSVYKIVDGKEESETSATTMNLDPEHLLLARTDFLKEEEKKPVDDEGTDAKAGGTVGGTTGDALKYRAVIVNLRFMEMMPYTINEETTKKEPVFLALSEGKTNDTALDYDAYMGSTMMSTGRFLAFKGLTGIFPFGDNSKDTATFNYAGKREYPTKLTYYVKDGMKLNKFSSISNEEVKGSDPKRYEPNKAMDTFFNIAEVAESYNLKLNIIFDEKEGCCLVIDNTAALKTGLKEWLGTKAAEDIFQLKSWYIDDARDLFESLFSLNRGTLDANRVGDIKDELALGKKTDAMSVVYTCISIAGIVLLIYGMFLLLTFYFDLFNPIGMELSLLTMITGGTVHPVSTELELRELTSGEGTTARYVSHKGIWIIAGVCFVAGVLMLNSVFIVQAFQTVYNFFVSKMT